MTLKRSRRKSSNDLNKRYIQNQVKMQEFKKTSSESKRVQGHLQRSMTLTAHLDNLNFAHYEHELSFISTHDSYEILSSAALN